MVKLHIKNDITTINTQNFLHPFLYLIEIFILDLSRIIVYLNFYLIKNKFFKTRTNYN